MTADFAPKGVDIIKSEVLEDLNEQYEGNEVKVDKIVARRLKDEEFKASLHDDKMKARTKLKEARVLAGLDPETGEKLPTNVGGQVDPKVSQPATADVEGAARKVAMEIERDKLLASISEDKRDGVKEIFSALTSGKEVSIGNINSFMEASMRAVGIEKRVDSFNRINSSSSGSIPPRAIPGPTEAQIAFAKKVGNDPVKVYGKEVDFSRMANAEKFLKTDTEN